MTAGAPPAAAAPGDALTWGGNLAVTSDFIYRGLSESSGDPALQADLHADTSGGTFGGVWASTRDHSLDPYAGYDLEIYLGLRLDLGNAWSTSFSARSHYYGRSQELSDDYQQLSGALLWLDRWALTVSVIPSAPRYWYQTRISRSPAWVVDTTGQWLIGRGLFLTGGAGYYRSTRTGPGRFAATGYGYGNGGVALEWRRWRLDFGYFLAQVQARELFSYPIANHRFAGTVSWRF
jgi:uncharacterized protein (TIGR02001 family)